MKLLPLLLLPLFAFPQCPVITQQPQSQTDCDGNSIRMIVLSNGTSFQWEKKQPQDANFTHIAGASQANYQIIPSGNISNPNGTQYRVKISLGTCSIYSEQVQIQLRKINSILNPTICERGNGVLESIHTEGATRFQWTRSVNGGPYLDLIDNDHFQGTQQNQLHIIQANQNLDGQKFKIRIDFNISLNNDNEGSTQNLNQTSTCPRTSTEITLQIKPSPTPRHAASTYNGCMNQAFTVNATGCSPYTTQWYDEKRNRIGTGARLNLTLNDSIPYPVFATCINAGCESLPSTGTRAQAFPKPSPPLNAGTPSEICPGLSIAFKASGGSNNIWYVTPTSTSPLSTATNYTTRASHANSTLTRFVSQNIRGCESARTPIIVRVLPTNLCTPEDTTITPPPIVNPPPADTTRKLPHVHLSYELHQNCESASYSLTINGCPNIPLITINRQFTHVGSYYASYVPENQELHITCPESIGSPLDILLPGLNVPEIQMQTNYQNFLCEGDKAFLGIRLPLGANMIGWEFNGHLYSHQVSMLEPLAAGNYQAIIQRNSCTYRSEIVVIEVRPKPQAPAVISAKNSLCLGDSLLVQTQSNHPFSLWNGKEKAPKYLLKAKEVGEQKIQVQISDEGRCWSDPSIPLFIQIHPIPEKPEILVPNKGGFCAGDSILVQLNKIGLQYRWSTNDSTQYLYSRIARSYEAKYQDSVGCWSPPSSPIHTILFPLEPQPQIQVKSRQFCQGESITLHSSPAHAYVWSTNEYTDTINVKISTRVSLKTQNQYGCWSITSKSIEVIAQENPWMPMLKRLGGYFIQATNQERVTRYEWKLDNKNLIDTSALLKIKQSGLFHVRAMRTYKLVDAPSVHCYSSYQVGSFGIPVDDPGIRIYPNPNRGEQITIEIQEDLTNVQMELFSLQGKKIKHWEINDTLHIQRLSLSDVISGNYILVMYANLWLREKRIFIVSD
jgi:hypothetical protein